MSNMSHLLSLHFHPLSLSLRHTETGLYHIIFNFNYFYLFFFIFIKNKNSIMKKKMEQLKFEP